MYILVIKELLNVEWRMEANFVAVKYITFNSNHLKDGFDIKLYITFALRNKKKGKMTHLCFSINERNHVSLLFFNGLLLFQNMLFQETEAHPTNKTHFKSRVCNELHC